MCKNYCNLCPRDCNVDRRVTKGFCQAPASMVVARADLHYWEEPCLSGKMGSGTIFFSYCNLKCVYCQNYEISKCHVGQIISVNDFVNICLELQVKGALNINLVTPTHYIPLIKEGLITAKKMGLNIPIVYNTSSYDKVSSLKELTGLIDIYLPDFKYDNNVDAIKYSHVSDYVEVAKEAIAEMYHQVGKPIFNNKGIMTKGVLVRHLVLPKHEDNAKNIIKYLYDTYKNNIYISIMNQYTPVKYCKYEELNVKLNTDSYDDVVDYAYDLGVRNAYIQDGDTQLESFIPHFSNKLTICD